MHCYALLPLGYRRAALGQSAVSRSPMLSTKSVGSALPRLSLPGMRWAAAHLDSQLIFALAQVDDMP